MNKPLRLLVWMLPLLLQSRDASAWGLYTHVFFAQWLLWGVPLLDPALRRSATRYPKLVLAGACLPDLAIVGKHVGTQAFNNTHDWDDALRMLHSAEDDASRALALGYCSHLLVDIIAHHHFVPAHEHLWLNVPVLTHACAEWAMDAHIRPQLLTTPKALLNSAEVEICVLVTQHFAVEHATARRATRLLARADTVLRRSWLPQMLYATAARLDTRVPARFDYFVTQTTQRLGEINQLAQARSTLADANGGCPVRARDRLNHFTQGQIRRGQPLPVDCLRIAPQTNHL